MGTRNYIFSRKKIYYYISDLSFIQNIIYLTANFVLVSKEKIQKNTIKREKIINKFYSTKVNTIYR